MTDDIDGPAFAQVAVRFAEALVHGHFDAAASLLDAGAHSEWSAGSLQECFAEMVEYFDAPADSVELIETMTDWPEKRPGDLGWAYVAINGESESEAVTVVVRAEHGTPRIREIEWGRP
jgi:hypothetical protein